MSNYSIPIPRLSILPNGYVLKLRKVNIAMSTHPLYAKRGKITTFSRKSAARLRDFFVRYDIDGSSKLGFTLTLPFADEVFEKGSSRLFKGAECSPLDYFKGLVNRVFTSFRKRYPDCGIVYRVELQQRGAPHIHGVCYYRGSFPDLAAMWQYAVMRDAYAPLDSAAFLRYGVKIDRLRESSPIGYLRYLIDHASKHKASQLGYAGKQWGIVARGNFTRLPAAVLDFEDDRHYVEFIRQMQRLNRYPVTKGGKVVKYRRNRRANGVSFTRGGGAVVERVFSNSLSCARFKTAGK